MALSRDLKPRPRTTYIDGLRGLLAVFVFNAHLTPIVILGYDSAFGNGHSTLPRNVLDIPLVAACVRHWGLFATPVVKLLYSGSPAVSMFFAISGYVMSLNWIDHVERRPANPRRLLTAISSSIFRRPLRLLLPSMVSMIMPFILCKTGYLDRTTVQRHGLTSFEPGFRFGLNQYDLFPVRQATWWAQARDLLQNCARLFAIFAQRSDESFPLRYNPVLWTVKMDLRASLVLLATQMALLEAKRPWRLRFLVILATLGWSVGSLECPLFWAGWIIAELHHSADQVSLAQREDASQPAQKTTRRGVSSFKKTAVFVLGCYVASYPTWNPSMASMFSILRALTPGTVVPPRTWHSVGVILMLYSLRDVPLARRLCEASTSQLLGRYSFSIYLVHVWISVCAGPALFSWVWTLTGNEHVLPFAIGFGVAYTILLIYVLLASVVFRVVVELPLSRFVDNLYRLASS